MNDINEWSATCSKASYVLKYGEYVMDEYEVDSEENGKRNEEHLP